MPNIRQYYRLVPLKKITRAVCLRGCIGGVVTTTPGWVSERWHRRYGPLARRQVTSIAYFVGSS